MHGSGCVAKQQTPDFLCRSVKADGQLALLPGAPPVLIHRRPPSYRSLPLAYVVLEVLSLHIATFPTAVTHDNRTRPVELVFSEEQTRALSRTRVNRQVWGPAVRRPRFPGVRTSTSSGTSTPRCPSPPGRASRSSRAGSGTPLLTRR